MRSPARNEPRSGLLQVLGERLFQSFVVLGKREYLCLFILERGRVYLDLMEGRMLLGNWILTKLCFKWLIFFSFSVLAFEQKCQIKGQKLKVDIIKAL